MFQQTLQRHRTPTRLVTEDIKVIQCKTFLIFFKQLAPLLLIFLICSGCAPATTGGVHQKPQNKPPSNGDFLFINGDFENALLEYQMTYEKTFSPEEKNEALFGLACTQLMLATTDAQRIEAIRNLHKWDATKGSDPFTENHHLLVLALKQQADLLQQKDLDSKQREINKNTIISSQKKQISEMASIVKILQKQLEELEAIDEIFKGKRKAL